MCSVSTGLGICRIHFQLADVQVNCAAGHVLWIASDMNCLSLKFNFFFSKLRCFLPFLVSFSPRFCSFHLYISIQNKFIAAINIMSAFFLIYSSFLLSLRRRQILCCIQTAQFCTERTVIPPLNLKIRGRGCPFIALDSTLRLQIVEDYVYLLAQSFYSCDSTTVPRMFLELLTIQLTPPFRSKGDRE